MVDELIKCLPDGKAFGCAAKYHACSKLIEGMQWLLNPNILPDMQDHQTGYPGSSPSSCVNNDQITHNMSNTTAKPTNSHAGTDKSQPRPRWSSNRA